MVCAFEIHIRSHLLPHGNSGLFRGEVDRENVLSSRSMVEGDETVVVQLLSLGTF